jgi:hypothetical protein
MITYTACKIVSPLQVPIMSQDLPENTGGTVVWDYHVIAVERDGQSSVVYDLTR